MDIDLFGVTRALNAAAGPFEVELNASMAGPALRLRLTVRDFPNRRHQFVLFDERDADAMGAERFTAKLHSEVRAMRAALEREVAKVGERREAEVDKLRKKWGAR